MNVLFAEPTSRYPIMALVLRVFASKTTLPPIIPFSRSLFLQSVITSILLDKSTSLFQREMVTLLIIMPYMAVYTPSRLREILPPLLLTLSRAICWKERHVSHSEDSQDSDDNDLSDLYRRAMKKRSTSSSRFIDNEDPGPYAGNVVFEASTPPSIDWIILREYNVSPKRSPIVR